MHRLYGCIAVDLADEAADFFAGFFLGGDGGRPGHAAGHPAGGLEGQVAVHGCFAIHVAGIDGRLECFQAVGEFVGEDGGDGVLHGGVLCALPPTPKGESMAG